MLGAKSAAPEKNAASPISEHDRINRVLIVEDDAAQRATLADIVSQEGFEPIATANAAEALDQVRRESFGVAILDFRLPDATGVQLLEKIKAMNSTARVIIHTGYGSFDSAKDAVNLGAFAYVEKGRDPGELMRHVHRAVRSHYQRYAGALETEVERRTVSLKESEERFRTLVESYPDGIAILDDHRFVFANRACARLFGKYDPAEIVGRSVETLIPESYRLAAASRIQTILVQDDSLIVGEFKLKSPGGVQTEVEIRGVPVPFEGRRCIQLMCRDVTEQKRAAEHKRLLDTNLRETQKMETAGQLAAGIAHDFNNLLTVILGNTEMLQERMTAEQSAAGGSRALVDQINQAGNRAAALTSRLLTFSRRQPVKLHHLELNRVLANLKDLLTGVLGETIQYSCELGDSLPLIVADVTQLEQIIMNFALNSRDAMPNGGRFSIATRSLTPDASLLESQPGLENREYVELTATDTGAGIPPNALEHVFEPFFTTKPAGKGTGLGLATVYGIVRQAGGTIAVSSRAGEGTRFTIYWPVGTGELTPEATPVALSNGKVSGTILLCEDDISVLEVTNQMLTDEGFSVLTAHNAKKAVEIATAHPGPIDLLITDLMMADMRGDTLALKFRELRRNSKVVVMTGRTTDFQTERLEKLGSFDFLTKPFKKSDLLALIRKAMTDTRC